MQPEIVSFIQQILSGAVPAGREAPVQPPGSLQQPEPVQHPGSFQQPAPIPSPVAPSLQFTPISGGSINQAYRISINANEGPAEDIRSLSGRFESPAERFRLAATRDSQWFCKINDAAPYPDLFTRERDGLALLRAQGVIRVPEVIACNKIETTAGPKQVLVMEWIEQGERSDRFWRGFGEQLARLHQVTQDHVIQRRVSQYQATQDQLAPGFFGLQDNNYMGALPQSNDPTPDWVEFLIQQRLAPQVRLAADKGLIGQEVIRRFERLYLALPGIFPDTTPALLHGDLWSGNFLCDTKSRPVLIDPAVYFGHKGMDLAMTTLFGGFEQDFYESYAYYAPLPANYREQWDICNLYPLLIHLNLFGKSYLGAILDTIQAF